MKKFVSIVTAGMLSLGGIAAGVSPALAVGVANPTFATTSYAAVEGTPFSAHLSPTFSNPQPWMQWGFGSRAFLNTTDCQSLPAGLTFVEEAFEAGAGVEPTYNIVGTPEAGSAGTYNICFNTDTNEEGWYSVGTSDVVTITVTAEPVAPVEADYTIDCQDGISNNLDVNLDGLQAYTKTVRIKGCGYYLVQDVNGTLNDYVGTSTDVVYTLNLPVDSYAWASGYNTWDIPNSVTKNINFWNYAPAAPEEPVNSDNGLDSYGSTNFNKNEVSWQSASNGDARISDAGTNNTGDAFDGFGGLRGLNWDETTFAILATEEPVVTADSITYKSSNIWSHDAQKYVDVIVERHFVGNTVTWNVNVFETGTSVTSTLSMYLEGNLGSDDNTTFVESNGKVTSNENFGGDPAIIWNTDGVMSYSNGSDDVRFNFNNAATATVQTTLLGYFDCATSGEVQAKVDVITADYNAFVNTDITEVQGEGCGGNFTPSLSASASSISEGETVNFTTNVDPNTAAALFVNGQFAGSGFIGEAGSFDWNMFGSCDASVVTMRIYNTTYEGQSFAWENAYDATVDVTFNAGTTGECAPAAPSFSLSTEGYTFVNGTENSLEEGILNAEGFNWSEGGNVSLTGLPAGLTYASFDTWNSEVVPYFVVSGTADAEPGDYTVTVTLWDDFGHETTRTFVITIEAAPVAPIVSDAELTLDGSVGDDIVESGAMYSAEGLQVESEWTLTLRSTPVVIASGVVDGSGIIGGTANIPDGLEAGWHSLTLDAIDANGNAIQRVVWFHIDANGKLLAIQDTKGEDVVEDKLAYTGSDVSGLLGGASALFLLGAGMAFAARRRNATK